MASIVALAARSAYQQSFDARPYTTLAITNGAMSAVGDAVAQASQMVLARPSSHEDPPQYDARRTLRFFTFGFCMGPIIGRWNKFLEYRFPLRALAPSGMAKAASTSGQGAVSGAAVMKRVAADQLLMAPTGLVLFLGSMGLMEGRDRAHIKQKFGDLYRPALLANWQVWPLAQVINFRYMPLPYRVPFQSTCGIFWNLYLSLLNASENSKQEHEGAMSKTVNG